MKCKKLLFFLITFLCFLAVNTSVFASQIIQTKLYYDGKLHNYNAQEVKISVNNEFIKEYDMIPIILNGSTLVPARGVFENLGCSVTWSEETKQVTVIRDNNIVILKIGNTAATKNGNVFMLNSAPKIINDYTMIPIRAVSEALGCTVEWDNEKRIVSIIDNYKKEETTQQTANIQITEAVTESTTSEIVQQTTATYKPNDDAENANGIKIVWDQIGNASANDTQLKRVPINGLDVISPTWFSIKDSKGTIENKASKDYVNWAHSQGYKVWALFSNSFNTQITHDTLSNPAIRQQMISEISQHVDTYNLDGINIDFESVGKTDGEYYVQFIREITEVLKQKNITVSVDMYVPTVWTEHYNMKEVGKIVDYVIIMAYDEHWSTSPESGSVASINWVDTAMKNAAQKVESKKLIMGIPFFTRRWAEENVNGEIKVSSVSMTMQEAYDILVENGASIQWNEECGQYYGEYVNDGVVRKIWLEDERSIEEKLKVAQKYNAAGIAAWKRGHEKPSVWEVINQYY